MTSTILKSFGTGQVTLPKKWRSQFKTKHFKAEIKGNKLTISPIEEEIVIFDADEFNGGEGVSAKDFFEALEKSLR